MRPLLGGLLALTVSSATAACSTPAIPPASAARAPEPAARALGATPIRHVVVIVQENRSFVNLFAGFPGADAPLQGKLYGGAVVPLVVVPFNTEDVEHSFGESVMDADGGKMDGFSQNQAYGAGGPVGRVAVSRLKRSLVAPYWALASRYTLADRMFPTQHGPSWTAHIDLVSGTTAVSPTSAVINFPSGAPYGCGAPAGTTTQIVEAGGSYGTGPFPCFTQFRTLADTLDAARVSWRYYAPPLLNDSACPSCGYTWSAFSAIRNVRYGKDWRKVVTPPPQVLADVARGNLAGVTWVVPDEAYSDHADLNATSLGPSWVSAVVNAIGQSKLWNSTAIVVVWDEWGGFYDDVPPPQLDERGLGIRVGCIIVSPYARRHYVSHTQYEFGSIVRFIEETFGLPPLGPSSAGYTDTRAASLSDSFDFTQTPTPFVPVSAPYPPSTFAHLAPSSRAPDSE